MLGSVVRKIQQSLNAGARQAEPAVDTELAAAALLLEVCRADQNVDPRETAAVRDLLSRVFALDGQALDELMSRAEDQTEAAPCLHEFTRVLKARVHPDEREKLLRGLWQVAFADGEVDKYEEHYIRRVADLVGVPHRVFIQARHWAASRAANSDE